MADKGSETTSAKGKLPGVKSWFVLLTLITLAASYVFHLYRQQQEIFVNAYYFRTLQEVAMEFNQNIDQYRRLVDYGEPADTIQAIFPSYAKLDPNDVPSQLTDANDTVKDGFFMDATTLYSHHNKVLTSIATRDVIPSPPKDFVLVLLVDRNNQVLSSTGGSSGLTIVDTQQINRELQTRLNEDWLKLAANKTPETATGKEPLPGHSIQIDIQLTTGKSRVFIQPFQLYHPIATPGTDTAGEPTAREARTLYVMGIQPEVVIEQLDNKRWNISLLLLSLVALLFLWTITRLLMLSRHQPIGRSYSRITFVATYLLFIALASLLVAASARDREVALRVAVAEQLATNMSEHLETDVFTVFQQLTAFHDYYYRIWALSQELQQGSDANPYCEELTRLSRYKNDSATVTGTIRTLRLPNGELFRTPPEDGGPMSCRKLNLDSFYHADDPNKIEALNLPPLSRVNIFPSTATVIWDKERSGGKEINEWFEFPINSQDSDKVQNLILQVFLMDNRGQQILPAFYFIERNKHPTSFNLAHRDYFREVKNRQGWKIAFPKEAKKDLEGKETKEPCNDITVFPDGENPACVTNFHIQRLLNLNTGTRGSTLGMPLCQYGCNSDDPVPTDLILGTDIVLPSLSLTDWSDPRQYQDFAAMVVDRETGEVLYHMDDRRSLIENLFRSGQGTADISQVIRSGRVDSRPVPGYYHGKAGQFVSQVMPISQWVAVVFVPDASTDSLLTNVFLASFISLAAVLGTIAFFGCWVRYARGGEKLRQSFGLPSSIGRYEMMVFTTLFLSSIYVAYQAGQTVELLPGYVSVLVIPLKGLFLLGLPLTVMWIGRQWLVGYRAQELNDFTTSAPDSGRPLSLLFFAYVGLGLLISGYQYYIGQEPAKALNWYQTQNLHPARLNQELAELQQVALTRYPNSITRHGQPPLSLLPITDSWRQALLTNSSQVSDERGLKKRHVKPEDIGTFSQLTFSTGPLDWAQRYLFGLAPGSGRSNDVGTSITELQGWAVVRHLAILGGLFALLCWLFVQLHRRVTGTRVPGSPGLLQHLSYIIENNRPQKAYCPDSRLVVDLHCAPSAPYLPVEASSTETASIEGEPVSAASVAAINQTWPQLQPQALEEKLPGLILTWLQSPSAATPVAPLTTDTTPRQPEASTRSFASIEVRLSAVDGCLINESHRQELLRLVHFLKARVTAGQLAKLTLNLGFHAYESLLLKAQSMGSEHAPMRPSDFANWAAVLVDFYIDLPEELTADVDRRFVQHECSASQLLSALPTQEFGVSEQATRAARKDWPCRRHWLMLTDADRSGREWASESFVLLKAGALYRYKWETCSNSEKLALYYLARQMRINAKNIQLLDQLALQGLINIEHGNIRILNHSFAYFVRHAEDTETLKKLVVSGDLGAWKEYRAPVTLVVLLLLAAIALTSGSSLYLIMASLLGLLGTIGSLVGSARLIRENVR